MRNELIIDDTRTEIRFPDGLVLGFDRQKTIRLSASQRAALRQALSEHDIAPTAWQVVVGRIEDGLAAYFNDQQQSMRATRAANRKKRPSLRKHIGRLVAAARLVRAGLPFQPDHAARERALATLLEQSEQAWLDLLDHCTPRGRPLDVPLAWNAYQVVAALDRAGVPLELGRKTTAVEVLGLFRQWAHGKPVSATQAQRSYDYEFSRRVIDAYRSKSRSFYEWLRLEYHLPGVVTR